MSTVIPALLALVLAAPPAQRRVLIYDLESDTASAIVAQNAGHAIVRQLGTRPDLVAIEEPEDASAPVDADLALVAGISKIGASFLAVIVAKDAKTGLPISGQACRSPNENALIACFLEGAGRALAHPEPTPVGRAGGTILVDTLDGYRVKENIAKNLSGVLRIELQKAGGLKVVAEKADWEVRGTVGRIDRTWIVHLELLDPEKKLANRVTEVFDGKRTQLIQATRVAARRLIGLAESDQGEVAIASKVDGAQVSIDGEPPRPISGREKLSLAAGKHRLELSAEGHVPAAQEFYVVGGQTVTLAPTLTEIPDPWYEKWWVWTALGAAVVISGTVAGIAVAARPDDALVEIRLR